MALGGVGEEKLRVAAGFGEGPFGGVVVVVVVPSVQIAALFLATERDEADEQREASRCLHARIP